MENQYLTRRTKCFPDFFLQYIIYKSYKVVLRIILSKERVIISFKLTCEVLYFDLFDRYLDLFQFFKDIFLQNRSISRYIFIIHNSKVIVQYKFEIFILEKYDFDTGSHKYRMWKIAFTSYSIQQDTYKRRDVVHNTYDSKNRPSSSCSCFMAYMLYECTYIQLFFFILFFVCLFVEPRDTIKNLAAGMPENGIKRKGVAGGGAISICSIRKSFFLIF